MIVLGVVIVIVVFLYLSLLALLRVARERRKQERSGYKKLPRVSHEVIETFCAELTKIQNDKEKMTQAGQDKAVELREEQPALFTLMVEILKQSETGSIQPMALGVIVYWLLKTQMEADVLEQSLDPPREH